MRSRVVSCSTVSIAAAAIAIASPVPARAQAVLAPGMVAVVTTDGFFVPDPGSATPLLFASAAALHGTPTLEAPAVEWERGTDSFLVATGASLFRVAVLSLFPPQYAVTDLTPASAQPLDLFDLDLHPATGDLFLLDQTQDAVLRYAPPFAAGMTAAEAIPVGGTARAIALDSRSHPNAVDGAENGQVLRHPVDGAAPLVVASITAGGLDHDPQTGGKQGTFLVAKGSNTVGRATGSPMLLVDLNYIGLCSPLARAPVDIEWSPLAHRAFVLAEDGVNPACAAAGFAAAGPNHVFRFPVAQSASIVPTLYTFAGGSGITGKNGDLAIVAGDFAFVAPYGAACTPPLAGGGTGPVLNLVGAIAATSTAATLVLAGAPANGPVALLAGLAPLAAPLPNGCLVHVNPAVVVILGSTDAQGALAVALHFAPLPQGLDLYLQAAVAAPAGPAVSEGIAAHVGA